MVVNWYGEGCFRIQSGDFACVTDPFQSSAGLTPPRGKADITVRTSAPLVLPYAVSPDRFEINGPGEYEFRGIEIEGWPAANGRDALTTFYRIIIEDVRLGLLGYGITGSEEAAIDSLGELDVLIIPAGGAPFISQEDAAKLVKQLQPKIVIPSFFKVPGLARKAESVAGFLEEIGQKGAVSAEKLVLKKKDMVPGSTKVAVLSL